MARPVLDHIVFLQPIQSQSAQTWKSPAVSCHMKACSAIPRCCKKPHNSHHCSLISKTRHLSRQSLADVCQIVELCPQSHRVLTLAIARSVSLESCSSGGSKSHLQLLGTYSLKNSDKKTVVRIYTPLHEACIFNKQNDVWTIFPLDSGVFSTLLRRPIRNFFSKVGTATTNMTFQSPSTPPSSFPSPAYARTPQPGMLRT